jgi:two-component system CheB/CheR fusion protein
MGSSVAGRSRLIVTGSSAGGIQALSVLLAGLPADFPAAIVLAQHLDPRVHSNLASILAKHTPLPVVAVSDWVPLTAGTVFVVPADRHVEITGASVHVYDGELSRPKPSIDLLFASAAEAFGERLIAVVLTGMGSDGRTGARAVKAAGGTVIIEDPLTASFPSMPASLEPELVDIAARLDAIAGELVRLVDEAVDRSDDAVGLDQVIGRIRAASGIDFSYYKSGTIKRRLARQMSRTGCATVAEYLALLDSDPAEFGRLVANFLIKVTDFFRDRELFDTVGQTLVPELIEATRQRGGRELRVWSAGCATGEEAYSLAITIAEAIGESSEPPAVRIFATDVDDAAIAFARRGIYPAQSIKTIEPSLLEKYFVQTDAGWEVTKRIRNMTVFGQHDLGQRAPFPRIDLALCRNVLIYFSKELQSRTLSVFAFSVRNGGYLVLGKSEATNPHAEYFAVVNPVLRIFRRYGERMTLPAAQGVKPSYGGREPERARRNFPAFERESRDAQSSLNEKLGDFLFTSSIGVILVDRHYDIVAINASARSMFDIHGVAVGEDFVHLTPPETSANVRAMLDAALRNLQPTSGGGEIAVGQPGMEEPRYLALSCYPEAAAAEDGPVVGAVILAVDVSETIRARQQAETLAAAQTSEINALRRYETYARDRLRVLTEANKEFAAVNADLRKQNDALVISAEEAETTTEEIETLNEEMQATNEELETLNEEFQATIEELNTTNDEHESRGRELDAQIADREAERSAAEARAAALAAIVDASAVALAAVNAQGHVVAANARFRALQDGATERSVQIDDDTGATISLSVVLRRAGEGAAFTFTYRSIAADQSLSIFSGDVRPLAEPAVARSIVELTPVG